MPSFLEIRNKRTGERKQLKICYTGKNVVLVADEATGKMYQCVDTWGYMRSKNRGLGLKDAIAKKLDGKKMTDG